MLRRAFKSSLDFPRIGRRRRCALWSDGCFPMKIMGHKLAGVLRPFRTRNLSGRFSCLGLMHTGSKIGMITLPSRTSTPHLSFRNHVSSITFSRGKEFVYVWNHLIINNLIPFEGREYADAIPSSKSDTRVKSHFVLSLWRPSLVVLFAFFAFFKKSAYLELFKGT